MTASASQRQQWEADNEILARIGAALYQIDTRVSVELPSDLADSARAAWERDDVDPARGDSVETDVQRRIRHRAGTLALIGAAIDERARPHTTDTVSVDLDAWFIGLALDAADDHGLIAGPPSERPDLKPSFITIDLDITGQPGQPLDALVQALARTGAIQNDDKHSDGRFVSFALGQHHETIDANVAAIVALVDSFDTAARAQWAGAASRILNVGIEAAAEPDQPVIVLGAELVAKAAAHQAGITLTHYPNRNRHAGFRHTTIR